jgi:uncharacterized protein (TIGR03435 family)
MVGFNGIVKRLFILGVLIGTLALCGEAVPSSHAQTPITFEVASVRLSPPGGTGLSSFNYLGTTRFTATNVSLPLLLQLAFGVDDYQILQKPSWSDSTLYDVSAKPEGETSLTYEHLKPLLQQLLEQRFHLTVHHETKYFKGYALLVAKGGPKLQTSKGEANHHANILPNGLQGQNLSLQDLASLLSHPVGRPVVDKTGIQGSYDFKLDYSPNESTDSPFPSVFTAVTEQLGLRLETQQVPVDIVVIDHVDREPTEN